MADDDKPAIGPAIPPGAVRVPCAVMLDSEHPQDHWLFIPHADGQWVSLCRLDPFSSGIIENWLAEASR